MERTFTHADGSPCPGDESCTYPPPHYFAEVGRGLSRCTLSPDCELGLHAPDAHPCGQRCEKPGEPCRYCSKPVPAEGTCLDCWEPITPENAQATVDELSFAVEVARLNREEGYQP